MAKNIISLSSIVALAVMFHSSANAADVKPLPCANWKEFRMRIPVTDSVPASKTQQENKDKSESKTTEVIKEVPKARKQEKPLAVTTPAITPVVIKPKIIVKPIIKVH